VSGLAFHAAALCVLLMLWALVGLPYGRHRLKAAEQAWFATFLTDQQFNERYPARQHSAAALRLDVLVRTFGTYVVASPTDRAQGATFDTPS
jgi:hypothetical protein